MQLSGARVLLTGATGGLGIAIAEALAARRAQLVLTGRNAEALQPVADRLSAQAVVADLTKRSDLNRLIAEAGEIDVLVANAALPGSGTLGEFTLTELDRVIDVNLRAPIVLARALAEGMVQRRRGQIVMISSLSGQIASPGGAMYSATKFGLRGFAHALRQDLDQAGVGVSVVLPGFIRDAGMFAKSGAKLPPGVRTRTSRDVGAGVVRAIERNRAEVVVAPPELRLGSLFGGAAPGLAAVLQRRAGASDLARNMAKGHRNRRP